MTRGRLEAFTDGVIAILITIMVLELRPPHGHAFADLAPLTPKLLSYLLSFVFLAIYWNNHHHLLQLVERVNGKVLTRSPSTGRSCSSRSSGGFPTLESNERSLVTRSGGHGSPKALGSRYGARLRPCFRAGAWVSRLMDRRA
jgi:hypothetical protein